MGLTGIKYKKYPSRIYNKYYENAIFWHISIPLVITYGRNCHFFPIGTASSLPKNLADKRNITILNNEVTYLQGLRSVESNEMTVKFLSSPFANF